MARAFLWVGVRYYDGEETRAGVREKKKEKGLCGLHLSKPGIAFLSLVALFEPRLLSFVSVTEWKLKMANWLGEEGGGVPENGL